MMFYRTVIKESSNDMEKANISVIIPCYNAEKTIINCLNSLAKQTFTDFEIILVDDGSTDQTKNLINNYFLKTQMNVKYVYQPNKGVSDARNKGLTLSNGKYIVFLDSDDVYYEDFLSTLFKTIEEKNVDTVFCYWEIIKSQDIKKNKKVKYSESILSQKN